MHYMRCDDSSSNPYSQQRIVTAFRYFGYYSDGLGLSTGIDIEKLADIGDGICQALGRTNQSKAARALIARRQSHETSWCDTLPKTGIHHSPLVTEWISCIDVSQCPTVRRRFWSWWYRKGQYGHTICLTIRAGAKILLSTTSWILPVFPGELFGGRQSGYTISNVCSLHSSS